ncbi:uncharacterized protein PpBr36_10255 [Pyricularia pennisetigena]|uniref:uncharacterized protein n=1 Tax=Pyricularia pennisetigena TaxID=1578925 RepID=UPI00114FF137|nr:uncharacterized protein PpBr36_10255 [Pyricularia pennisetigena]TLS21541.1 hypothetical protein PpBr36_10255 [Pyricularia pennisetigena]
MADPATTTPHQPDPALPLLDHIVILVPPRVLQDLPAWLTDNFTVITGGVHAGGATENKLILLADGLIAFTEGVDPAKRAAHRWGARPEGRIVDWALTLPGAGDEFPKVQDRVRTRHAGVVYGDPVPGGRTTPSGTELKWAVADPRRAQDGKGSDALVLPLDAGEAPFWCFDRTPRRLRVPHDVPANVEHPSGAVGVAGVTVFVADSAMLGSFKKVYDGIYGEEGSSIREDEHGGHGYSWNVGIPVADGGKKHTVSLRTTTAGTFIRLSLYSTSNEGTIGGVLHDKWTVDFDLIKA